MKKEENIKKNPKKRNAVISSKTFTIILSLISILGFIGIVSETIFYYSLKSYIESLWILILGIGLLIETRFEKLKSIKKGLNNENFPQVTNLLIGVLAVAAGIFSFPVFKINNPSFSAIRGILSIIAIIAIIIETWVIKNGKTSSKISKGKNI